MNQGVAVTRGEGFSGRSGEPLFSVNAGVPVVDALEHVSLLLGCVDDLAGAMGHEMLAASEGAFVIQHLTEMAKALVDAAVGGVHDQVQGGRHVHNS